MGCGGCVEAEETKYKYQKYYGGQGGENKRGLVAVEVAPNQTILQCVGEFKSRRHVDRLYCTGFEYLLYVQNTRPSGAMFIVRKVQIFSKSCTFLFRRCCYPA